MNLMPHLIAAPILLPLLTAAVMLMLGEKHRPLKAKINARSRAAIEASNLFCML